MKYARRRCTRNPNGASPTHTMETDEQALCGARRMRSTEYWEEMEEPLSFEACHNCYMITEARAGRV